MVATNDSVTFTCVAQDSNGDQLAYYWDFGDFTFGTNGAIQNKSYPFSGRYNVRCEVSDMKGGVTSKNMVITVGEPTTLTVSGRVLDLFGNPVQGVRVHNSGTREVSPPQNPGNTGGGQDSTLLGTYRCSYTDSDGYYVIGNLPPGGYNLRAFKYGYHMPEMVNFIDPIQLVDGNAEGVEEFAEDLARATGFPRDKRSIHLIGPSVGPHVGPGAYGAVLLLAN
jgi:hypothetical protein